jgi:hypothetical protein
VLPTRAPSEPVYFWATLKSPTDSDPGQIVEGSYRIAGNTVTVIDTSRRQVSVQTLKPGQDPLIVARRLLREANKPADFYRSLRYPDLGLA